jgi:Conserved oligomeric complex COG6
MCRYSADEAVILTHHCRVHHMHKAVTFHYVWLAATLYTLSQAHDAVRYIGDMLAWVHQTAAMEKELLTALFGVYLYITYLLVLITFL